MSRIPLLALAALVAGCTSGVQPPEPGLPAPPANLQGMDQVMGKTAESALALLGEPSLDRREGMARQLQFAGACVLDIFYFQRQGQPSLAIHAEARLPNGRDVQAQECLRSLLKARELLRPKG